MFSLFSLLASSFGSAAIVEHSFTVSNILSFPPFLYISSSSAIKISKIKHGITEILNLCMRLIIAGEGFQCDSFLQYTNYNCG